MHKLGLNDIREKFLSFFESKQHLRLPSFSLVPENDPSILLINAGMTPLKPFFTGEKNPPNTKLTTCQKCIRTLDIENVGKTSRHGTFFEMLGNFSFGDYFKREAIAWAWEFVTEVMHLPKEMLYISVYEEDDEAYDIWHKEIKIKEDRIVKMGKEDNFWEHGTGPCGPCSEIYFDRGEKNGCGKPDCMVGCECDRFVEFWNLVFTQYDRKEDGTYVPLPNPNIDTGMGLERLACIMQDVNSLFEVDTIKNVLDYTCNLAAVVYGKDSKTDISLRVITDHIRSTTMLISDGVVPSNEGRGYVLRRLIRRAARHARLLGIKDRFLSDLAMVVIKESSQAYPELLENQEYIKNVISTEENRFDLTIDQGLVILKDIISNVKNKGLDTIPGTEVFRLHDTFGFPIDLTREIAEENNLKIDEEGFKNEMDAQRQKARDALKSKAGSAWGENIFAKLNPPETIFLGYNQLDARAKVLYIVENDNIIDTASEGRHVVVILDKTTMYGESGGQVGDVGYIDSSGAKLRVNDTHKTDEGLFMHICTVQEGSLSVGDEVTVTVDPETRRDIARNHTVTHLIHKALKNVLGSHVNQAGSLVEKDRLRFDFTHFQAVTSQELQQIEDEVNTNILAALPIKIREMSFEDAKNAGVTALFGEKYGDWVRVVQMGDYSMELCGGTHLENTAMAGLVKIVAESSVAAGIRRIEALTGFNAISYFKQREAILDDTAKELKANTPMEVLNKVHDLVLENKELRKELNEMKSRLAVGHLDSLINNGVDVSGIKFISGSFEDMDINSLKDLGDSIRDRVDNSVVLLSTTQNGKVNFVSMATKAAISKGAHSGQIVKATAVVCGGGGGGRPDMAQAGGKDPSKVNEAIEEGLMKLKELIK